MKRARFRIFGQRIVLREELGAQISLPLLPRAPVEAERRQPERDRDDRGKRDRHAGDLGLEGFALGRLVDIDFHDPDDLAVLDGGNVGFGVEGGPVRLAAGLLDLDLRLAPQHRLGRLRVVDGDRLAGFPRLLELVGGEPQAALGVEDLVEEDVADLLRLLEEGHALGATDLAPATIASRSLTLAAR